MKTLRQLAILFLLIRGVMAAQTCNVSFVPTIGPNGQVTVVASATPALLGNAYVWTFGVPYIAPISGPGTTVAVVSYTASGTYPIVLTISATPGCTASQTVNIVITPTCALNITSSASQSSLCNGSATVSAPAMCGAVSYTWSNLATGSVQSNLCPGSYTVIASGSSSLCCPTATGVVTINTNTQCNVTFTPYISPSGQVTVVSTATPALASNNYSWTFGAPYIPPVVATNSMGGDSAVVTYTANGNYPITLSLTNFTPGCSVTQTINVIITPTCSLGANTITAYYGVCNGQASITVPGMCSPITYSWSTGTVTTNPWQYNLCPGTYTVRATSTNSLCCQLAIGVITIPNYTVCNVSASFTHAVSSNTVFFGSTSTGTVIGSVYRWDYGDGSPVFNGTITSMHTYSTQGSFNVRLVAINNSVTCYDTSAVVLVTPIFCNLQANFTYSTLPNDSIVFINTSTGVSASPSYSWKFGDGGIASTFTAGHKYQAGAYVVTLTINNNYVPACISTKTLQVYTGCALSTAFNHTVAQNGFVQFADASTGTFTNANYLWYFGDGNTGTGTAPYHIYSNAGTHYVKCRVSNYTGCVDSLTQAINITGVNCVANSGFSVVPTGTPQLLDAIPYYPYNVSAAVWNWGDGNSTASLYASHVYTASGNYSMCLSVTVSCGQISTTCYNQQVSNSAAMRGANSLTINIRPPATKVGLDENSENLISQVFPNPSSGFIHIANDFAQPATYSLRNLNGQEVLHFEKKETGLMSVDTQVGNGLYFLYETAGETHNVYRIIILKD